MTKNVCIALLALALSLGVACAGLALRVDALHAERRDLATQLERSRETARQWLEASRSAAHANELLQTDVRACLDREAEAAAVNDEWRVIIDSARTRDMAEKEKKGVPDNATRRRLFDDLDRPL